MGDQLPFVSNAHRGGLRVFHLNSDIGTASVGKTGAGLFVKERMMRRIQRVLTGCLALIVGLSLLGCEERAVSVEPVVRPVRAMTVTETGTSGARIFSGRTEAVRSADLAFRVSGRLERFPVRVGEYVEEGSLVGGLDPRDFRTRIASIEGELSGAEAVLKEAGLRYERYGKLYVAGSVAKSGLDQAEAAFKGARARVEALSQQLYKAEDDLRDTRLQAPFSGYVTRRHVDNFETVSAGHPVVRLQDTSAIEVVVGIPDTLVAGRESIQSVVCTLPAFPGREFPARIRELSLDADPVTGTFAMTVVFDRPGGLDLAPGMAANVRVQLKNSGNPGVVVPETALFSRNGKDSLVWIVDDRNQTVYSRKVLAEEVRSDGVLISAGLSPGDVVVTAGVHSLGEGQQVRLLESGPAHRGRM
jgi:RND family efflux transporter MFP subunit